MRNDISPGYQLAQTAHAVADFAIEHPEKFKAWKHGSNYLCCLSADAKRIDMIINRLSAHNIHHTIFREPDIGDQITAIAVEALPQQLHKQLFKNLKLGLS